MFFGVVEDYDFNLIKMGIGKIKVCGVKVIGVNFVCNGYNVVVDEWVGIMLGIDGLFILVLVYELMKVGKIDFEYFV